MTTATCTPRAASFCAGWAGAPRRATPTRARWSWSTTRPSGACSSGGWRSWVRLLLRRLPGQHEPLNREELHRAATCQRACQPALPGLRLGVANRQDLESGGLEHLDRVAAPEEAHVRH